MATEDPNITDLNEHFRRRFWQLIGGEIEHGEDILGAAKREIFEETGLK